MTGQHWRVVFKGTSFTRWTTPPPSLVVQTLTLTTQRTRYHTIRSGHLVKLRMTTHNVRVVDVAHTTCLTYEVKSNIELTLRYCSAWQRIPKVCYVVFDVEFQVTSSYQGERGREMTCSPLELISTYPGIYLEVVALDLLFRDLDLLVVHCT